MQLTLWDRRALVSLQNASLWPSQQLIPRENGAKEAAVAALIVGPGEGEYRAGGVRSRESQEICNSIQASLGAKAMRTHLCKNGWNQSSSDIGLELAFVTSPKMFWLRLEGS